MTPGSQKPPSPMKDTKGSFLTGVFRFCQVHLKHDNLLPDAQHRNRSGAIPILSYKNLYLLQAHLQSITYSKTSIFGIYLLFLGL